MPYVNGMPKTYIEYLNEYRKMMGSHCGNCSYLTDADWCGLQCVHIIECDNSDCTGDLEEKSNCKTCKYYEIDPANRFERGYCNFYETELVNIDDATIIDCDVFCDECGYCKETDFCRFD